MSKPRSSARLMLMRGARFLLAGAIINIAIAWVLRYRVDVMPLAATITSGEALAAMPVSASPAPAKLIEVTGTRSERRGLATYTLFAFHRELTGEGTIRYANQVFVSHAGWPCRSMHGWSAIGRPPLETGAHGLWRIPRKTVPIRPPVSLPLFPLWPGFAINTILYAVLLWLPLATPAAIRRWRRTKRGVCPACGYPIGQSEVCTECGKALKS